MRPHAQADLFESPWVTGGEVDRSGAAAYVHLIRGENDPERSPRSKRGDTAPHLTTRRTWTADAARAAVEAHLADGVARTFNRIAIELLDQSADVAFGGPFDEALWQLVAEGRVEHTMAAPVLFRVRRSM